MPFGSARFTLSYRDVEDLLAERGLDISYETVRRWFLKFGEPIARNLRTMRPTPSDYWHLDEMVIVIRGRRHWLWRAVDNEGEVLDFLVQSKRSPCNLMSGNSIGVCALCPTLGHAPRWGDPLFCYSMKATKPPWRLQNAARSRYRA
jgi:hypothetical protein